MVAQTSARLCRGQGYSVPVLNERAVRAAAGIVFLIAILSFMNAWLIGNFQPTRVFVVAFLIDFTLRIFMVAAHFFHRRTRDRAA